MLWGSAAATTAGAALFAAVHSIALTLLGAAVLGFAGTTMLTCIQAILSDRHGERRDEPGRDDNPAELDGERADSPEDGVNAHPASI